MSLISVALLCMCVCAVNAYSQQRIKDKQCTYKGQKYSVGTFPSKDGCNTCTCKSRGKVRCTKKKCCQYDGQQYSVGKFQNKDGCKCQCTRRGKVYCKKCDSPKQCTSNGILYNDGETFKDKCNTCTCINGQAACTKMSCPTTCQGEDGKTYSLGEKTSDPCNPCECIDNGKLVCIIIDCFEDCINPVYVPGECCPKCDTAACQWKDGNTYLPGQQMSGDQCNGCTCENGAPLCIATDCTQSPLDCEGKEPGTPDGQCCPVCPKAEQCTSDGILYNDGDTFKDKCNTCTCSNGQAACTRMSCPTNGYQEDD